jgi:hypothetical protein
MSDLKTSLLVKRQVPEFVREEHPKFVSFLEAYYEFLENKQGNELNDLTSEAKQLRYLSDVDESLDDFESNFFNMYASLLPQDIDVSKEFLIKNLLPVYLSKGSEASFKLLFRLLFGKEAEVSYPKDKILRASDGKWVLQSALRTSLDVRSIHTGNGSNTEFKLAQQVESNEITVTINGSTTTNYYVKKELKKIVFNSAPANNSTISVLYQNFDETLLSNRKVTGNESGASAVIEKVSVRQIAGDNYLELYLSKKNIDGTFINAETVDIPIIVDNQNVLIQLTTLSDLQSIEVVDGGASYNVGDPVIVQGPAGRQAKAIVDRVATGTIEELVVFYGGAGFEKGAKVDVLDVANTVFDASVLTIDTTSTFSPNTVNVFNEIIGSINVSNLVSSANFGFPSFVNANANTTIADALAKMTISNIGPIVSTIVNVSTLTTSTVPNFNALAPIVSDDDANNVVYLNSLGIIGRIDIDSGGTGYQIGEYITFTKDINDFMGSGANAQISQVDGFGAITRVRINSGGTGYSSEYFPTLNVASTSGNGASLSVTSVFGDGEVIKGLLDANVAAGQILSIQVLDPGLGYRIIPKIDLSKSGDGTAQANAQIQPSLIDLRGKWTTTDSLLSTEDRRIQGRDYYVNYAYVLSSKIEFEKYKTIFKKLIKPAGFLQYAEYTIDEQIVSPNIQTQIFTVSNTISGRVSTNGTIYVTGTNTKFLAANTNGILVPGSNVAINSEIRMVNVIVSNTEFTVNTAFTGTYTNEILRIV